MSFRPASQKPLRSPVSADLSMSGSSEEEAQFPGSMSRRDKEVAPASAKRLSVGEPEEQEVQIAPDSPPGTKRSESVFSDRLAREETTISHSEHIINNLQQIVDLLKSSSKASAKEGIATAVLAIERLKASAAEGSDLADLIHTSSLLETMLSRCAKARGLVSTKDVKLLSDYKKEVQMKLASEMISAVCVEMEAFVASDSKGDAGLEIREFLTKQILTQFENYKHEGFKLNDLNLQNEIIKEALSELRQTKPPVAEAFLDRLSNASLISLLKNATGLTWARLKNSTKKPDDLIKDQLDKKAINDGDRDEALAVISTYGDRKDPQVMKYTREIYSAMNPRFRTKLLEEYWLR